MKIFSLMQDGMGLAPVEVEVMLMPGLPEIRFVGLADQHLKESSIRIKAALQNQGFAFPRAQQVVVNLRPNHIRKTSQGIELAVAVGILGATEQIPQTFFRDRLFVYGEVTLEGEIICPRDIASLESNKSDTVITGRMTVDLLGSEAQILVASRLRELTLAQVWKPDINKSAGLRPRDFDNFDFSSEQSRLLEIAALGGQHILLAGAAGSGKTTMARTIQSFYPEPQTGIDWWPLIAPHHTSSSLALIGGGQAALPGEVARAHRGMLLLDELLEFRPEVQEALREPMDRGCLRIARGPLVKEYPCRIQVIATTNLCPCGDWTPQTRPNCRFGARKCQSVLERLSGPMVDRFDVIHFSAVKKVQGSHRTPYADILAKLNSVRDWAQSESRTVLLHKYDPKIQKTLAQQTEKLHFLLPSGGLSERRKAAIIRTTRTLANLDFCEIPSEKHLDEALSWSYTPFEKLRMGMLNPSPY